MWKVLVFRLNRGKVANDFNSPTLNLSLLTKPTNNSILGSQYLQCKLFTYLINLPSISYLFSFKGMSLLHQHGRSLIIMLYFMNYSIFLITLIYFH